MSVLVTGAPSDFDAGGQSVNYRDAVERRLHTSWLSRSPICVSYLDPDGSNICSPLKEPVYLKVIHASP